MIRPPVLRSARSRARLTCPAVLLLLAGLAPTGLRAQSAPPAAPVRPVTDTLHGVAVTDPYRWMEDEGPELDAWLRAQDAYTRAVLERVPEREKILAEMRALVTDAAAVSQVRRLDERYVYLKRNAGEQVAKLYIREGVMGRERLLVDPTALGDVTRRFTIGGYALSPDGRYLAFSAAPDGSEIGSIRVVEVATGRSLPDTIGRAFWAEWHPGGRAFAYTRLRDLPPGAPARELELCRTVYLHVVGTDPAVDRPLVGCGVSPRIPVAENRTVGVAFSTVSGHVLAGVGVGSGSNFAVYTAPTDSLAGSEIARCRLLQVDQPIALLNARGGRLPLPADLGARLPAEAG